MRPICTFAADIYRTGAGRACWSQYRNSTACLSAGCRPLASSGLAPRSGELASSGHVDFAITLGNGSRLRANLFRQRHGLALALRLIASQPPDIARLQLPDVVRSMLQLEEGLILITGATGSGKSTTLAALVDSLNRQQARHIITLEDPIEFVHYSQRSLIQQREIGAHCASFQLGLKAALREDPDVILLGELRDSETIRLALTAAETGHLVLATLHTRGATQAVDRLVDVFPAEEKTSCARSWPAA